jgi:hypothetical protein
MQGILRLTNPQGLEYIEAPGSVFRRVGIYRFPYDPRSARWRLYKADAPAAAWDRLLEACEWWAEKQADVEALEPIWKDEEHRKEWAKVYLPDDVPAEKEVIQIGLW